MLKMFDTILDAFFFLSIACAFLFIAIVIFIFFLKNLFNKIFDIIIHDENEFFNEN